jgi:hypothetical protein
MVHNSNFERWWNAKGLDPTHPLYGRLQKFFRLGADLDFVFSLCVLLAVSKGIQLQLIATRRNLASRKRRWTKETRALWSTRSGGALRLTEVARLYTDSIIRSTVSVFQAKGLLDSTPAISAADLVAIKEQALEPFTSMQGFPEDWQAAIDETGPADQNLFAAVGFSRITPEQGEWIKKLMTYWQPSVFQNGATKRRDVVGTMFLLFLTEHMRKATVKRKPHFELVFNTMKSLEGLSLKTDGRPARKISHARKSAEVRVAKLKEQWPDWQVKMTRLEQMIKAQR